MGSGSALDLISTLSDFLLVLIISNLTFKEALRTSILSKRWRHICRETRNVSFKEAEITSTYPEADYEDTKRDEFVRYAVDWVSSFSGGVIDTFELSFSRPLGFEAEMKTLIDFAAVKKVKNLVLDFSDRLWVNRDEVEASQESTMVLMPESFYKLTSLVKLKLLACRFDPSKLAVADSVEFLYFGWMSLDMITSLLSKAPLLESLQIKNCWKVGLEVITGINSRLTKLVFKNCVFAAQSTSLDLPSILVFKFSGKVHSFLLQNVNKGMDEVSLDFGRVSQSDAGLGTQLRELLCSLVSAKTVTICPFLIQLIQDNANPLRLKADMETRRLVLKTSLEPREFVGIRCMINSCPYLETLTFQLVAKTGDTLVGIQIDRKTYWLEGISHRCLKNTLKSLEVWNFCGGVYELQLLQNLIRMSRVLERVDIYLPMGLAEHQLQPIRAAAEYVGTTFKATSDNLAIYLH